MRHLVNFDDSYRRRYQGTVTYRLVNQLTGEVVKSVTVPNVITYEGADFFAKSIAGLPSYRITHMYGEHADPGFSGYVDGSTNGLVAARTDTVAVLRTSPRDTVDAEASIIATAFATSDPLLFSNNVVTFFSVFDNPSVNGRIFVGAGLMSVQPDGSEILVAHNYTQALTKLTSFAIQAVWSIRFL